MRYDKNFAVFAGHTEWYIIEHGKGYIPTKKAPEEAVRAMKEFNKYTFAKNTKAS